MESIALSKCSFKSLKCGAQHLFPDLGRDITERQYGADCRLWIAGKGVNWPVIRDTMDEFVIAHTVQSLDHSLRTESLPYPLCGCGVSGCRKEPKYCSVLCSNEKVSERCTQ